MDKSGPTKRTTPLWDVDTTFWRFSDHVDAPTMAEAARQRTSEVRSGVRQCPLGCHYHLARDCWEITVFLMRVEIVGGGHDGEALTLPFYLDLSAVPRLLDEVETLSWQTGKFGCEDDLGPHVSVTGRVGQDAVWLRILADAPKQSPIAGTLCSPTLNFQPE